MLQNVTYSYFSSSSVIGSFAAEQLGSAPAVGIPEEMALAVIPGAARQSRAVRSLLTPIVPPTAQEVAGGVPTKRRRV